MKNNKMKLPLVLFLIAEVISDSTYILNYENITIPDLGILCSNIQNVSITEKCSDQLQVVCANSTLRMTLLDASSKFPYPGLGYSSRSDYGNYDQCMTVDHTYDGGRILGKFCAFGLLIPDIHDVTNVNNYYKLSVCKPDACSASDYNAIVGELLPLPLPLFTFADEGCSTTERTITTGDKVVITIFGVVIFLMVASTFYDIFLYYLDRETIHPLCIAFSVLSNGRKLLHITRRSNSKEQIQVFHGMRVISMMWIVAGHGMGTFSNIPVVNTSAVATWLTKFSSFHMTAAPLAVDTFFFMSGFLLAFQYFKGKTRKAKDQVLSVPYMIIHRYLRLTPALLMVFLVMITVFKHFGSGPVFDITSKSINEICEKNWWRIFLYIQNYGNSSDICLIQTWYLSADMQIFLISPLIIIPTSLLMRKYGFKVIMWGLLTLNIFFVILPTAIRLILTEYNNDYDAHSRLIDYFIGVMMGIFLRIKNDTPFLSSIGKSKKTIINLVTWPVILVGMLAVMMCIQDKQNHSSDSNMAFDTLMRPAWSIGLCWITYSCYHGQGGFINWILCRPVFQVLGRLTYCIYLIHLSVIIYRIGTSRTKVFFNEYNSFYQFCGDYIVSVILAVFWTLAFESPIIIIEKYIFGGRGKPAKHDNSSKIANIEEGAAIPKK